MSGEQPKEKRRRRTKAEITKDLSGNYTESSSRVDSIQKSMEQPSRADTAIASENRAQFLYDDISYQETDLSFPSSKRVLFS